LLLSLSASGQAPKVTKPACRQAGKGAFLQIAPHAKGKPNAVTQGYIQQYGAGVEGSLKVLINSRMASRV